MRCELGADAQQLGLESPKGSAPTPDHAQFVGPAVLPDGSVPADAEHAATYSMLNWCSSS